MTQPTLDESLTEAHALRAARARDDLRWAEQAPALFKPEWTSRAIVDLQTARLNVRAVLR